MKAIIFHAEKCSGCNLCRLACSGQNEGVFNPRLARLNITSRYTLEGPEAEGRTCNLCLACAQACPAGAIREKNGRLAFDEAACTDCGLCVDICPQGVIVKRSGAWGYACSVAPAPTGAPPEPLLLRR